MPNKQEIEVAHSNAKRYILKHYFKDQVINVILLVFYPLTPEKMQKCSTAAPKKHKIRLVVNALYDEEEAYSVEIVWWNDETYRDLSVKVLANLGLPSDMILNIHFAKRAGTRGRVIGTTTREIFRGRPSTVCRSQSGGICSSDCPDHSPGFVDWKTIRLVDIMKDVVQLELFLEPRHLQSRRKECAPLNTRPSRDLSILP